MSKSQKRFPEKQQSIVLSSCVVNTSDDFLTESRSQATTENVQCNSAVELPHIEEAFIEQPTADEYVSDDSDVEILEGNYGLVST